MSRRTPLYRVVLVGIKFNPELIKFDIRSINNSVVGTAAG